MAGGLTPTAGGVVEGRRHLSAEYVARWVCRCLSGECAWSTTEYNFN